MAGQTVVRHGDVKDLTIDGRSFSPQKGSAYTITLGGYDNEVEIAGNGDMIVGQETVAGMLEDAGIYVRHEMGDLEFLQERKDSAKLCPVTVTYVNGVTYQGDLIITGESKLSGNEGTANLTFSGSNLRRI